MSPVQTPLPAEEILGTESPGWRPAYEVVETGRRTTFAFDLPGVLRPNVHVACGAGLLRVWGCRAATPETEGASHFSTRPDGSFAVELPIDARLDPKRIFQKLQDGVLTVELPVRRASIPRD